LLPRRADAAAALALALADVSDAMREATEVSNRTLAEGFETLADAWRDDSEPPPPPPTRRDQFRRGR
jgi:hypothetical protein